MFGFIEHVRDSMNTQGIGMGLYITKMLVEEFGGKVNVRSELGNGSTFSFTFKLSQNIS
jgi:signal transduction histidine kinase